MRSPQKGSEGGREVEADAMLRHIYVLLGAALHNSLFSIRFMNAKSLSPFTHMNDRKMHSERNTDTAPAESLLSPRGEQKLLHKLLCNQAASHPASQPASQPGSLLRWFEVNAVTPVPA